MMAGWSRAWGSLVTAAALIAVAGCAGTGETPEHAALETPIPPNAANADSLIRDGEAHFAHLWQLTFGGENAEAYWSNDGSQLIFQSTRDDLACDQMFVLDLATGETRRVSSGAGRTTCGYFYENDARILYASTHRGGEDCPPEPDFSQGYVWPIYESYDIFTAAPDGSDLRQLTDTPGYDAEATVSTDGRWIVFTSVRDGDLELYKMASDGSNVTRLTDRVGYDGGAFFSRDGEWICYRSSYPSNQEEEADYRALLAEAKIRPSAMNLWVMRADGSDKRQVTTKPGASFAPYFTPDGSHLIYSSNWENPRGRNFDLYLVPVEGGEPQPVTREESFDGFPMFSPDGRWLAFSSNRGAKERGETNLFVAEWRP